MEWTAPLACSLVLSPQKLSAFNRMLQSLSDFLNEMLTEKNGDGN